MSYFSTSLMNKHFTEPVLTIALYEIYAKIRFKLCEKVSILSVVRQDFKNGDSRSEEFFFHIARCKIILTYFYDYTKHLP